jgi:hypothetical protein
MPTARVYARVYEKDVYCRHTLTPNIKITRMRAMSDSLARGGSSARSGAGVGCGGSSARSGAGVGCGGSGAPKSKRAVTSAVPGMPVSTMRKFLATQRNRLAQQTELSPFSLNEEVAPGMPAWKFSFLVSVGFYQKRALSRARDKADKAGALDL